jgi:hypothetical protein
MKLRRSGHNLGHEYKTTFNMGIMTPIMEPLIVTRGDTFRHSTNSFMRLETLVHPCMHQVHVNVEHAYFPMDLLWEDAREFLSGGEDNDNASEHPYIDFSGSPVTKGSLAHYFGLPIGYAGRASALPFRAYALYWNEHKRDDQIQAKIPLSLASGQDTTTNLELLNVNWHKDPFTSCRPDDQLGDDVTIPIAGNAPVKSDLTADQIAYIETDTTGGQVHAANGSGVNYAGSDLYADLSAVTGISITDLALAIQTGKLQEILSRRGNDYPDWLKRHGIKFHSNDIDRSVRLGGGSSLVQFSEVLSTAESGTKSVGDLAGHGISAMRSNRYMEMFVNDGIILSFCSVRPKPMYMQAVNKLWLAETKEDYFAKEYEAIGMEEVLNKEIKHDHTTPDGTFGYRPRYEWLRQQSNIFTGEFADLDLDWHLGRKFASDVALEPDFLTCNPTKRVFADQSQDCIKANFQHKIYKKSIIRKRAPILSLT